MTRFTLEDLDLQTTQLIAGLVPSELQWYSSHGYSFEEVFNLVTTNNPHMVH